LKKSDNLIKLDTFEQIRCQSLLQSSLAGSISFPRKKQQLREHLVELSRQREEKIPDNPRVLQRKLKSFKLPTDAMEELEISKNSPELLTQKPSISSKLFAFENHQHLTTSISNRSRNLTFPTLFFTSKSHEVSFFFKFTHSTCFSISLALRVFFTTSSIKRFMTTNNCNCLLPFAL
jgi:hypothetical protein